MILLAGVSSFLFTGCQKENSLGSSTVNENTTVARNTSETAKPQAVHIRATYDFANFPDVSGTYVATGALNLSGATTMHIGGNNPTGQIAHCVVVLISGTGTITIDQECEFAINPANPFNRGQWKIVGGTGAYANLRGNGVTTMPPPFDEDMTGVIF